MPVPTTTPIPYTAEELVAVSYDEQGLVRASVPGATSNQVVRVGWLERAGVRGPIETWIKGDRVRGRRGVV